MSFFAPIESTESFDLFGVPHLTALAILVVICALIVGFRRQIISSPSLERRLRYTVIGLLTFQQITYYLWKLYAGEFLLSQVLPLSLCALSVYLGIYGLITLDKRVFAPLYFFGMCGALQALLTPSMDGYNFPHFRFFQFFMGHIFIVVSIIYLVSIIRIHVNLYEFLKTFVLLQLFSMVAILGNTLTGGNYMFLSHKPDSASIMDLLADWPVYLLQLELVALVFMGLFALPFAIKGGRAFWSLSPATAPNPPEESLDEAPDLARSR